MALEQHPVKLVVENDQTPDCGILSMLNAFFHAAEDSHLPVSMTFDMANWLWVGQDAFAAAERPPATSVTCTSRPRRKACAAGAPLRWTIPTAAGAICWPACRTRRRAASNSRCRVMTGSRHPPLRQYFACGVTQDDNVNGNDGAAGAPDVVTLGEAMAMFVAAQTGDLAEVETFTKRIAGAELNVAIGPPVWA